MQLHPVSRPRRVRRVIAISAAALIALPEAKSTSRSATSSSSGMNPLISPGTPPDGMPDLRSPAQGIPRSRVSDSGRHAVRR